MKSLVVLLSIFFILLLPSVRPPELAKAPDNSILSLPTTPNWERYRVKDEEFSALLPTLPAMTTMIVRREDSDQEFKERVLGAYSDGVVYAIHTVENQKRNPSLDDLIRRFGGGSPKDSLRQLEVGGFRGKEYASQTSDRRGVSQYFVGERHSYVFRAAGSTLGNPEEGMARFFSSIKFERKPDGKEVVDGPGEQPNSELSDKNDAAPFNGREVSSKAPVITKPEPSYTEEARRNQTAGIVVLRGVFSSSGTITNIRVLSGLPHGLTDRAIGAARQIRFIPAIKDGRFVSQWVQIEYNFNLY